MEFKIDRIKNGWLLEARYNEDNKEVLAGIDTFSSEEDCFIQFLNEIITNYGPMDSRYSEKRIRAVFLPGDKFEGELDSEYKNYLIDIRDRINCVLEEE